MFNSRWHGVYVCKSFSFSIGLTVETKQFTLAFLPLPVDCASIFTVFVTLTDTDRHLTITPI